MVKRSSGSFREEDQNVANLSGEVSSLDTHLLQPNEAVTEQTAKILNDFYESVPDSGGEELRTKAWVNEFNHNPNNKE